MGGQNYSEPIVQNEPVSETTSEFNYATASCLNEVENQSSFKSEWKTSNDYQKKLIDEAEKLKPFLPRFKDELKSYVSNDPEDINKVLRENGFKLQIPGIKCDLCLYIMSLLHIKEAWQYSKGDNPITIDALTSYKGVMVEGYNKNGLLKLVLNNGDDVFIFVSENKDQKSFDDVIALKSNFNNWDRETKGEYVNATIPHIDYMIEKGIDVGGIRYGDLALVDGIHGNHFILNTGGIDLKEYTAVSATRGIGPQVNLVIDKPFFISIYRPGVPYPYFTDYITKDKWVLNK
jgi:hypothetical protein